MQDNSGFPKTMANWPPQFNSWLKQMSCELGMLGRWMRLWRWVGEIWDIWRSRNPSWGWDWTIRKEIESKELEEAAGKSCSHDFTKKTKNAEKSMSLGVSSCPQFFICATVICPTLICPTGICPTVNCLGFVSAGHTSCKGVSFSCLYCFNCLWKGLAEHTSSS